MRFIQLRDKGSPPAPSVASPPSFKDTERGGGLRQPNAFTISVHLQYLWSIVKREQVQGKGGLNVVCWTWWVKAYDEL